MKIRTKVKAGIVGNPRNHNEKLASSDVASIDQKKIIGKKLRLSKETVRELKDGNILNELALRRAAGGAAISGQPDCTDRRCYYTY